MILEGADKMQKKTAKIITALISVALSLTMVFSECLTAYAADDTKKTGTSKGIIIAVMVSLFIVAAIISGFISFKHQKNKLNRSSDKNNSSENNEE